MDMLSSNSLIIKVKYAGETRRLVFSRETLCWSVIEAKLKEVFSIQTGTVIRYLDSEQDSITVSSDEELFEMVRQCEEPIHVIVATHPPVHSSLEEEVVSSNNTSHIDLNTTQEDLFEEFSSSEIMQMLRDIQLYIQQCENDNSLMQTSRSKRLITTRKDTSVDGALTTDIEGWNESQVIDWMHACGLDSFADIFRDNAIDGVSLLNIDHDALSSMGITQAGKRVKIIKAIAALKIAQTQPGEIVSPSLQRLVVDLPTPTVATSEGM